MAFILFKVKRTLSLHYRSRVPSVLLRIILWHVVKKKKMSVLLSVEKLTVCGFFHDFLTVVVYEHLFFCGSLLTHKKSKELHDN